MFYRITESENVGVKDGLAQAELVKKLFSNKKKYEHYVSYFLSYDKNLFLNNTRFPSSDFDFENVRLRKGARLTDFLYFAPSFYHRFLVSKKVQEIFLSYNLPPFKFYDVKLFTGNGLIDDYKFFFCPSFSYDVVDFKHSLFSKGNADKEYIKVSTSEEFISIEAPLNREKIALKSSFERSLDLFNLLISPDLIISERLHNEFLKQNVTGIRMFELADTQFEILF